MKLSERLFRRARPSCPQSTNLTPTKDRGVALVTFMTVLSVLTTLSIAIIMLAGQEQRSAIASADSVWVRQLADIPVNLVLGQIREAPRPDREKSLFGQDIPSLWTSQSGMLRT
jgi:hypothetical protein